VPAELGDGLFARLDPDDAPAVLLLEICLHETTDGVVVLDEEKDAPGRCACHVPVY
jgi:hypothetical protein